VLKDLLKETAKGEAEARNLEKPHMAENSYVSYVIIDLKENEISVESRDKFSLPNVPVGATTG
jgi:hypothetical protein